MRVAKCVEFKISEELYTLLPINNGYRSRYVLIDGISYEIFSMLKIGKTINEVIKDMLRNYDVEEEQLKIDLKFILHQWVSCGIIYDINDANLLQDSNLACKQIKNLDGECESKTNELTDIEIYNMMYQAAINRNEPFKVYFELTYNCNLRCRHCYIQENVNHQENIFLSKDIIFRTIDELKAMGTHEVVITGGECTLHKDLMDIVKYICNAGMKLILLTNANIIDDMFIDKIMDLPIADIRVSIYGKAEVHNKLTQVKNSFEKSLYALRELRRRKGIGTAVILVTNENYGELDDLTTILKENGIEYDFNAFIFPTVEHNMAPTEYRIDEYIREFVEKYVINCSGSKCAAGISRFRIDPYGTVSPCDLLKHEKLGNLHNSTFRKIFNSEKRKEWLCKLDIITKNNTCSKCEDKKFCNSCLGLIYMEHQSYDEKLDFLCKFADEKRKKYERIKEAQDDVHSEK